MGESELLFQKKSCQFAIYQAMKLWVQGILLDFQHQFCNQIASIILEGYLLPSLDSFI